MALTVGTNSWVTVAYADDYFSERYNTAAWAGLPNSTKEQLLIHAYHWINQQPDLSIPASSTDTRVKQAQCEVAWYIYNYFESHEKRRALYVQGVTKFKISKFSEDLQGAGFPEFVKDMLEDFLTDAGGQFPLLERDFDNNS